jgi:D-alanine-D-alanine ligase
MTRDELKTKKIAVLMGGLSAERPVSLRTGQAVLNALTQAGYRAIGIDAGRDLAEQLKASGAEVAFIALHGRFGEDGTVQGLLEILGVPYTGSGVLASSLAIDKVATKQMLIFHELPTPGFHVYRRGEERAALLMRCKHFPLVVKPAREGSTIGVSIVKDAAGLEAGLDEALRHDGTVLIEEFIAGAEVTVGVLDGTPLPIIQVVPKEGFYDYTNKYTAGRTEYLLPAPLPAAVTEKLQQAAVAACQALGCSGAARVDFMVRQEEIFCLEVNTIPGMTETSLLPKAAGHAGISFAELCERILASAGTGK